MFKWIPFNTKNKIYKIYLYILYIQYIKNLELTIKSN